MKNENKTKEKLVNELLELPCRIAELEISKSQRKRADEVLPGCEEKYRVLVESATDMIYMIDKNNKVLSLNKAAAKTFGKEPKEIIGKSIFDLFPEGIATNYSKSLKKIFETEKSDSYESRMVIKGKESWNSVSLNPVRNNKGKVVAVMGVTRDITSFKQAENKLRDSERKYRSLFDNMLDGFAYCKIIIDDKSNPVDFVYIEINDAFEKLTGLKKDVVTGKKVTEVIPGIRKAHPELFKIYGRVALTGKPTHFDIYFEPLKIWLSISVYCPQKGYFVAVFENITERKKAEEKLKVSLKEKEVLLREIHHRVKNNLQVISSLLNLQSYHIKGKKNRELFEDCQNRIKSIALIYEKLYQSKDLARIDFKEYTESLVSSLMRSYGASLGKVVLKIEAEKVLLGVDSAIPCGLIISELVSNSLKHAFPDGKKGEVNIALHSSNKKQLELVVSDNGVGLPENLDFRKAKSLGLHLVSILAEDQLGGQIKLDRNKGTKFQIKFKAVK